MEQVLRVVRSPPLTALSLLLAPAVGSLAFVLLVWISSSISHTALSTVETVGLSLMAYSIFAMAAEVPPLEHAWDLVNCWFQEALDAGEDGALGVASCLARYPTAVAEWQQGVAVVAGIAVGIAGFRLMARLLHSHPNPTKEATTDHDADNNNNNNSHSSSSSSWITNIASRLHLVLGVFIHATLEGLALALAVTSASARLAAHHQQHTPQSTGGGGGGEGEEVGNDAQTLIAAMLLHNLAEGCVMAAAFGGMLFRHSSNKNNSNGILTAMSRILQPMVLAVVGHSGQALMFLFAASQHDTIQAMTTSSVWWEWTMQGVSGFCVGTMLAALGEEVVEFFEE